MAAAISDVLSTYRVLGRSRWPRGAVLLVGAQPRSDPRCHHSHQDGGGSGPGRGEAGWAPLVTPPGGTFSSSSCLRPVLSLWACPQTGDALWSHQQHRHAHLHLFHRLTGVPLCPQSPGGRGTRRAQEQPGVHWSLVRPSLQDNGQGYSRSPRVLNLAAAPEEPARATACFMALVLG